MCVSNLLPISSLLSHFSPLLLSYIDLSSFLRYYHLVDDLSCVYYVTENVYSTKVPFNKSTNVIILIFPEFKFVWELHVPDAWRLHIVAQWKEHSVLV